MKFGKQAETEIKTIVPAVEETVISVSRNVGLPIRQFGPRKWSDECYDYAEELEGCEPGANMAVVLANPKAARSFRSAFARYKAEHNLPIRTQVYLEKPDTVYLVVTE